MLGWIEKVVPQPPVICSTPVVVEKSPKTEPKAKESKSGRSRKKGSEGTSSQPAAGSEKKEAAVTPSPAPTTESSGNSGRGVLTWLSEGLGKVVPQPSQQAVGQDAKTSDAANQTEAQNVGDENKQEAAVPPEQQPAMAPVVVEERQEAQPLEQPQPEKEPLPEPSTAMQQRLESTAASVAAIIQSIQTLERRFSSTQTAGPSGVAGEPQPNSDDNAAETNGSKKVFTRLLEEFEKMIPQPEKKTEEGTPAKPAADQGDAKGEPQKESSPTKPVVKHRASADSYSGLGVSLFPQTLGGDGGSGMFKRLMQGLEKVIPHPVSKEKPDEQIVEAAGQDSGQERSKGA